MTTRLVQRVVNAAIKYRELMMLPHHDVTAVSFSIDGSAVVFFGRERAFVSAPPRKPAKVVRYETRR